MLKGYCFVFIPYPSLEPRSFSDMTGRDFYGAEQKLLLSFTCLYLSQTLNSWFSRQTHNFPFSVCQ